MCGRPAVAGLIRQVAFPVSNDTTIRKSSHVAMVGLDRRRMISIDAGKESDPWLSARGAAGRCAVTDG